MNDASPLVVGAGPVGAICALALQQHGVAVRVLEARSAGAGRDDTRTLALSHGSRLILERLGVWSQLRDVTPITRIHISQRGGFGIAQLSAAAERVPALGYVLAYGSLGTALDAALAAADIRVQYDTGVARVEAGGVYTDANVRIAAPLVVVADGGRTNDAAPQGLARDYVQRAIVCEVTTELPHRNLAYERFTPDGPAALLPKGDAYGLVWTTDPDQAERLIALDDAAFLAALYRHFGGRQGQFWRRRRASSSRSN
jgi:2-polyprenyl-6-methoxyphenol hydroxylase and related FAD-dependent oxidoreductases